MVALLALPSYMYRLAPPPFACLLLLVSPLACRRAAVLWCAVMTVVQKPYTPCASLMSPAMLALQRPYGRMWPEKRENAVEVTQEDCQQFHDGAMLSIAAQ